MRELPTIALSVRQPWAWAIVHAGKDIENRSAASVRMGGMKPARICIHASRGMTRDEYESAASFMQAIGIECPRPDLLIRGAIIGTVDVKDILKESDSKWFFGPRGLLLSDPRPCLPIFLPGALGYFNWGRNLSKHSEVCAAEQPSKWMLSWPAQPARTQAEPASPQVAFKL